MPPQRASKRRDLGPEQRARILDATTDLYGERGYAATRIADIATRARVSRRTIYAHFRDLSELRFAVYERALATFMSVAATAVDRSHDDRLRATATLLFEKLAENPHLARVVVAEFRLAEPRNAKLRSQLLAIFVSILMDGTEEDHRAGLTPERPDELTMYALLGVFEGLILHLLDRDGVEEASLRERVIEVALHVYRRVYPWKPRPPAGG